MITLSVFLVSLGIASATISRRSFAKSCRGHLGLLVELWEADTLAQSLPVRGRSMLSPLSS